MKKQKSLSLAVSAKQRWANCEQHYPPRSECTALKYTNGSMIFGIFGNHSYIRISIILEKLMCKWQKNNVSVRYNEYCCVWNASDASRQTASTLKEGNSWACFCCFINRYSRNTLTILPQRNIVLENLGSWHSHGSGLTQTLESNNPAAPTHPKDIGPPAGQYVLLHHNSSGRAHRTKETPETVLQLEGLG